MTIKDNQKRDALFFFATSILVAGQIFQVDQNTWFYIFMAVVSMVLLTIKILLDTYTIKQYVITVLFSILMVFCYAHSHAVTILLSPLFIIGSKNINIIKLFRFLFYEQLICFIAIVLLGATGLRNSNIFMIDRMIGGSALRFSLGFEHSNQLHMYFFCIVGLYLFVFYRKVKWTHAVVIMLINLLLFNYSRSRTGFVLTSFAVLFMYILRHAEEHQKKLPQIISIFVLVCTLFTLITTVSYSPTGPMSFINKLLQGRLSNAYYFYKINGITLFGQSLDSNGSSLIIDNSYAIMLLQFGVVYLAIFNIAYYLLIRKILKSMNYSALFIVISFSAYGVTEGFLSNIFLNFSLFFIGSLLFDSKYEIRTKLVVPCEKQVGIR